MSLARVVAMIGSGGKTTLLHTLAERLSHQGKRVVMTTTTHLAWEDGVCSPATVEQLNLRLGDAPLLCGYAAPEGRLTGIPGQWYGQIAADHILVEADGSRGLPLKWHGEHEPVLPEDTGALILVVGLSGLDRPAEAVVHRWQGEDMVDEAFVLHLIERALNHANYHGPTWVVLNQADTPELKRRGQAIAEQLTVQGIDAVVTALKEGAEC